MKKYVLGLCFLDRYRMVAVTKNRPESMVGKLNAPGGHIEEGESPREAVAREVAEETGVQIDVDWWHPVGIIEWKTAELHLWSCSSPLFDDARTTTEERVSIVSIEHLDVMDCTDHLRLFVGMAMSVENLTNLKLMG